MTLDAAGLDAELTAADPGTTTAPLVFLHEGLGARTQWRDLPSEVRARTGGPATLVYSRHGYGHSAPAALPRPVDYMHHEADEVLPALLAGHDLHHPILIGHSDGASIALLHAGGGHDVAGLVLIAPHVFVEDVSIAAIEATRTAFAETDLRDRLARHHADPEAAFRGWNDVWLSPAFRDWNIEDRLGAITAPVLLIQGDADPYGTMAQLDAIERGVTGPVTRLEVAGAGHAPQRDEPALVTSAIADFIISLGLDRSA